MRRANERVSYVSGRHDNLLLIGPFPAVGNVCRLKIS